jgi:hypothetical protein
VSGSSRPRKAPVKAGGAEGRKSSGWTRHFEGWQPGVLAVFVAGTTAALVVWRPVAPVDLPEPTLEPRALERAARADDALARAAAERRPPLDFDVRALGSAICAYGKVDAGQDDIAVMVERKHVADAARRARAHGDESLLMLRAFEQASFLRELRRWEADGTQSDELRELGGAFVTMAEVRGWAPHRKLLMDDAVRRAMFKKRWNELVLVDGARFDLTEVETRALLRFQILHPPRDGSSEQGISPAQRASYAAAVFQLKKIDELAAIDPAYPADLARGVINYGLHRYPVAVFHFRRHLEAHPDGALTLRAQNYLDAALAVGTE